MSASVMADQAVETNRLPMIKRAGRRPGLGVEQDDGADRRRAAGGATSRSHARRASVAKRAQADGRNPRVRPGRSRRFEPR